MVLLPDWIGQENQSVVHKENSLRVPGTHEHLRPPILYVILKPSPLWRCCTRWRIRWHIRKMQFSLPVLLTAAYQPVQNYHSKDELVPFVFWTPNKYLRHKKCSIIMTSHAIYCNTLMKGIHFMFIQLSCVLPGVLCSNLVLVNRLITVLLIKSSPILQPKHRVDINSFTLTLICYNFMTHLMFMLIIL